MQPTTMNHQMMGYDRSSTMFSPDGRLLQVEYAKKAVKQGTTSLGIVCKDGVILLVDKRVLEKLLIGKAIDKVAQVDEHIGACATGFLMDGRVLVERAQLVAQQHRVSYNDAISVLSIVKDIANVKQQYTQFGGARPFGVSLLFGGVDDKGSQLYITDVTGIYFAYKATAIGEFETQVKEVLEKEYKDGMTKEQAIRFGISCLKRVLAKDFDIERIDCAFIDAKTRQYALIVGEELKKYSK